MADHSIYIIDEMVENLLEMVGHCLENFVVFMPSANFNIVELSQRKRLINL